MVTGQKVRWVLDLMRGTEFAGRQITSYEVTPSARPTGTRSCCTRPRPATSASTSTELKEQMLALGEARSHDAPAAVRPRRCGACCSTPARSTGFGWSCFTAPTATRRRAPAARVRPALANEHLRVDVDASDGTYSIDDDRRPARRRAAAGSSTAATAATRTTTPRPTTDVVVDRPDAVRGRRRSKTARCAPASPIDADYTLARVRGRRRARRARSAATRRCACAVRTTLELRAGERFLRVAHEIDNQARDHRLRAHFPLPAPVDRLRRRVRVRGRAPRAHRRGRRARVRPADVPVAPLRRRVRRQRRPRAAARRPARVRGRRRRPRARAHAAARGRLSLAHRAVSSARTRPARPTRSNGPQLAGHADAPSTRCMLHRGDWRAADCYGAADAFLVAVRTHAGRGAQRRQSRPATGHRAAGRRRRGVGRARACRAASSCACSAPRPTRAPSRSSTTACPPAATSSTSAAAPSPPFEGEITLRPWQLATLHVSVRGAMSARCSAPDRRVTGGGAGTPRRVRRSRRGCTCRRR